MSRKHFEAAAALIREMKNTANAMRRDLKDEVTARSPELRAQGAEDVFVAVAQDANPRFDAFRFRRACLPEVADPRI